MDDLLAELLGMGFEMEQIERCKDALNISPSSPFNLQTATEWLLDQSHQPPTNTVASTLVLTPPVTHSVGVMSEPADGQGIEKPLSSSRDFKNASSSSEPLTSRYNCGPLHMKDKKRFEEKTREDMVKKARERRKEDIRAKELLHRQIQDDRKALQDRSRKATPTVNLTQAPTSPTAAVSATPTLHQATPNPTATCRVQVRLPSGDVLRRVLPSSALLDDIISFVASSESIGPSYITVVQMYPRREFTPSDGQSSLQCLGLCPSASLIINIAKSQPQVGVASDASHHRSPELRPHPEPMDSNEDDPMQHEDQPMVESDNDFDNPDSDNASYMGIGNVPLLPPVGIGPGEHVVPPLGPGGIMGPGGIVPIGTGRRGRRARLDPFHSGRFGGEGHRLGGKEGPSITGRSRAAAHRRVLPPSQPACSSDHTFSPSHHFLSLATLCTRVVILHSSRYGMPSCSHVSPVLAQRLLSALKKEKKLNSKTLTAFYGCPLHVINLDNYPLTTNELLGNVRHFPQLTELSLASCSIITDGAMDTTFPYLSSLKSLNINGCTQLSQDIFRSLRGCKGLEVVQLSHVKLSDQGLGLLLHYPLLSLRNLDLSHTEVTVGALEHLPTGAPVLDTLNVECTLVSAYHPLPRLPCLRHLNLSRCPTPSDAKSLRSLGLCRSLKVLIMSGMSLPGSWLEHVVGLPLLSLKLPDRNLFYDDAMVTVSSFPLTSLDLTDFLHVTDEGLSFLPSMTHLTSLSLARTKLTDAGMPYLQGLLGLRKLSLDNTLVTDAGVARIAGLNDLEVLSLSDTGVTSQLLVSRILNGMKALNKLNLSRTTVDNEGVCALSLPSLLALNLNWTCITDSITLALLVSNGCSQLDTLCNRNINQPLPEKHQVVEEEDDNEIMQ